MDACTVTLDAAAGSGGLTVSLSSSSTAVSLPASVTVPANAASAGFTATVSQVGTAQPVTLTASAGSGTDTFALQLNAVVPTLTVATSGSPSTYGGAVTFTAAISSGPAGTVTFYDGGASIGTGATNGTTATFTTSSLTAGSHLITAKWPGSSDYGAATSGALTQLVNKAAPAIIWATPAAITYGTALSSTQQDASSKIPGRFSYSPAAGAVLAPGSQTLSVTFTPVDTTDYAIATAKVTLAVNAAGSTIQWAAPAAIAYGTPLSAKQLNATSTVAGTFAYTPAAGTVLKAGAQTLSVTFKPANATAYKTATTTVTLTVNKATPAISWTAPSSITYGTALSATQLNASSTVAGTFNYSPAAGTVLTAGSHTIAATFTPTDSTDYATAASQVSIKVKQATPAVTWATPAAITYGTALSSTQQDASSKIPGRFSYSPAAGAVLAPGSQTLSVTFTPVDTTDYAIATAKVTLAVNAAGSTIQWAAPAAIAYGTPLSAKQLNATSTVAGTFAYTPAAGTVLKAGAQTLSVTFKPANATAYKTATTTVTLTVNKATPAISWTAPSSITYGTALSATQLNASSTVAGTFNYSPAAGTVLTAGSHTIAATFTPTDSTDYATAASQVSIKVKQATPAVTWATPAAITYGTALSSTQLDASSKIPGTFSYSPAAGAALAAGSQTLSVTFKPADTTDYTAATKTVTLTVNQGTSTLSIDATSVGFGSVALNTLATQTVTLTSTGSGSVTVSSATVTGTGFTLSGPTFPATLTSGHTATLGLQFDPATAGAATGLLTVKSNSSTTGTAVIALSGTGMATSYSVDLSWDAPSSSADPVAGYNVYRSLSGSSAYARLNSSLEAQTAYVDSTVVAGQTYDYIVESVDSSGVQSVPSSPVAVTIP